MAIFMRLLANNDKHAALANTCVSYRRDDDMVDYFDIDPSSFDQVPGSPFCYWVSENVRNCFDQFPTIESSNAIAHVGLQTSDDFRFIRVWWEPKFADADWVPHAKGGPKSFFYSDVHLVVRWADDGKEIRNFADKNGKIISYVRSEDYYFRQGLTWTKSTTVDISFRCMPQGVIFGVSGLGLHVKDDCGDQLLSIIAVANSAAYRYLLSLSLGLAAEGRKHYEAGLINRTPVPKLSKELADRLQGLAISYHDLMMKLGTTEEALHAFLLPAALRKRLGDYDPPSIEAELRRTQSVIDDIAFDLYRFSDADRAAALGSSNSTDDAAIDAAGDGEEEDGTEAADQTDGLLSWAAGVAFGRFDWRLATGEREAPPEPDPFDPLPAKSPGMLPDDAEPFYAHSGILVDDQGHPNDLARLIEEVLARVEAPVPADVRRWLQRDFFKFHLGQYSKSRRKAPIYWPISTSSGSYTLWLYYPSLTDQTLFIAVNDFIEPKLKQVGQDVAALRTKGSARSRDDEKTFEALQTLELELIELRDTLLAIAQTYRPNHDDGVQITAAPLWQLFRHKPWQKVLKDTWTKLEKGDYDWAHLAMAYWPDRAREKCKTDKSLAIAHDLEHLYVEPDPKPTKTRGRKKDG